jgi:hypothetical protein
MSCLILNRSEIGRFNLALEEGSGVEVDCDASQCFFLTRLTSNRQRLSICVVLRDESSGQRLESRREIRKICQDLKISLRVADSTIRIQKHSVQYDFEDSVLYFEFEFSKSIGKFMINCKLGSNNKVEFSSIQQKDQRVDDFKFELWIKN